MWVIRQRFERRRLSTGQVTITCRNWSAREHHYFQDALAELMEEFPYHNCDFTRHGEVLYRPWDSRPVVGSITREWLFVGRSKPTRGWIK
jgi:hypothetical protein